MGRPVYAIFENFGELCHKIGFPAVSRHSGTIFGLSAPKLVEIDRFLFWENIAKNCEKLGEKYSKMGRAGGWNGVTLGVTLPAQRAPHF